MTARSLRLTGGGGTNVPTAGTTESRRDVHHANPGFAVCALPFSGHVRESVGRPLRRICIRVPPPGRAEVGACRSRIGLRMSACSIATVAAIGLTTLSPVLTGSAAAAGSHGRNGAGNHSATRAGQSRTDGTDDPSRPSTPDRRNGVEEPAPDPDPTEALTSAHDKCKRFKVNKPLPPWCTDPASGWMGSTTHRVETNIPTPMGICDSSVHSPSGCRPARRAG
jgi:hypothetical protein